MMESSDQNKINPRKVNDTQFHADNYPSVELDGAKKVLDEFRTDATEKTPEDVSERIDTRDDSDSTSEWNAEKNQSGRHK